MSMVVLIFLVCAIPAAFGALVTSSGIPGGALLEVFFGLAAFTLPICYAIIHAAEIRKGEEKR
jgi:hypothetical protein